jgi:hypothetical protein
MKRFLSVLLVLSMVGLAHAAIVTKFLLGSQTSLLTTELNSKGSNAFTAASSAFNNTVGQTGDGYVLCDVEGVFTFGGNPTANTAVVVWFLMAPDGTNYEDTPTASITPGRAPDVVLPVTAGQTGTRVTRRILCPWGLFKAVAKNDGTGQTLAASGNTVKIRPVTIEGIAQ